VGLALVAAALFRASTPLAKGLLGATTPQLLAGLLYLGAGTGLLVLQLVTSGWTEQQAKLTRRDAPWLAGSIAFGGVLGPLLLMLGLRRSPASGASLLLNLEGVFTSLLAWAVFREHIPVRIAIGMAAIIAGGAMLSWEGQVAWGGFGNSLAVAGACFCWAIDNNLTQRISAADPIQIARLKGLAAGAVNTALALLLGARWPTLSHVVTALMVGFVGYGVSLACYVVALRELGTARTGAYFSLAPFIGAVLAVAVWREPVTPLLIAAGIAMALGLWLHLTERHVHWHKHEPIEHTHAHTHDIHHQHAHGPDDPPGDPHTHAHRHERLAHSHAHYPDIHHRHGHS